LAERLLFRLQSGRRSNLKISISIEPKMQYDSDRNNQEIFPRRCHLLHHWFSECQFNAEEDEGRSWIKLEVNVEQAIYRLTATVRPIGIPIEQSGRPLVPVEYTDTLTHDRNH
jgi:hypothetical protein